VTAELLSNPPDRAQEEIGDLLQELLAIRADMLAAPTEVPSRLDEVHLNFLESARNLLHYLALRRRDLRPLQRRLAAFGLSSLGRAEPHVLGTVDAVLGVLHRLMGCEWRSSPPDLAVVDFTLGRRLLADHTDALLGPPPQDRNVRIMVTMPSQAANDYALIHSLLKQGMDCMRINCAHDDPAAWLRMIEHLRRAEQAVGRTCRVVMDLAGPKLRTGPLEPGPAVVRIRPTRDAYGRVIAPARVWLTAESRPQPPPTSADATLLLPEPWLALARVGNRVGFRDARGAPRSLLIVDITEEGCWAESRRTAYVVSGTVFRHDASAVSSKVDRDGPVGPIPPAETSITLFPGDLLVVTRDLRPGRAATLDSVGNILTPAHIGCTIPEVFDDVRPGDAIRFDDGKIGGIVEKIEPHRVHVRVTHARLQGGKLRAEKGINLPDSKLRLPAITEEDVANLAFVARHADVVELSFANTAADVDALQCQLAAFGERQPAIVLKIETRRGFENLPDMLLTAMRAPCCGVMIARGDLAVECGFERLAEVQEEILWICEAAHVPVIWATQVLESLAKEGMPSRAEITDAAMGERAECVMLNKGPHMLVAIQVLKDILQRMQNHQSKKQSMLRELHLAHALSAAPRS
jgi:pyruvate kinase